MLENIGNVYQVLGQPLQALEHYQQALRINRSIGNKRLEGTNLGNAGDALYLCNRLDEAKDHLQKAVEICESIGFSLGTGAFAGTLSLILAEEGKFEEAISLVGNSEKQTKLSPVEHGKLLSKKARILHLAGQKEGARLSLQQAQEISVELNLKEESELARSILKTRQFLLE
jgi:tetratricopeptide (TPR) repeat protein